MSKTEKVAHVLKAGQSRMHHCHWPGCTKEVPPARWGCYRHWMMLPASLRAAIWNAYQIGQEETRSPSREYLEAARKVQEWIRDYLESKKQ